MDAVVHLISGIGGEQDTSFAIVENLLDAGVSFAACRNTLDTMDLDETDLVDVDVVPEGAVEVIRLQNEGYAYLRP